MLTHPIALILGAAGTGKTVAVAAFLLDRHTTACWYRIESEDRTFLRFFRCLITSIRMQHPDFGDGWDDWVPTSENPKQAGEWDEQKRKELAVRFVNEAFRYKEPILVILDQYERVMAAEEVDQWVQHVLTHLPSNLQILVISRIDPDWSWQDAR